LQIVAKMEALPAISEVLCEGWMVKSPPVETKTIPGYSLFKARWRRRWFVLQQGKLPRQYLLNYYTDETKKRLKGTIALDECEQVEHGLVDRKGNYDYMFSINTPSRIYFLAVDTEKEMDTWVNLVCKACGLRDTTEEKEIPENNPQMNFNTASPTVITTKPLYANTLPPAPPIVSAPAPKPPAATPKPSISSPYIHISECFSGKPPYQQAPPPPPRNKSIDSARHDSSTDDEQIYFYMPSAVNTSTIDRNGKPSIIMIPAKSYEQPSLAYIDLDLPKDDEVFTPPSRSAAALKKAQEESSTIYKTVDFEMTKAFNQTRKDVEEKRLHTSEQRN